MSKFCENCGAELSENDVKCPNCGKEIVNATANKEEKKDVKTAETTGTTTTTNTTATKTVKEKKPTETKTIIAVVCASVVALLVIIAIVATIIGGQYKSPFKYYFNGLQKANSKTYAKAFSKLEKETILDKYDDDTLEEELEDAEDEYGDNVKISYKVLDKIKLDKEDLNDIKDDIEDALEADDDDDNDDTKVNVSAGYQVVLRIKIKGSEKSEEQFQTYNVYKVNGQWCMVK